MEMTMFDAFQMFPKRLLNVIGHLSFYFLRPREVKTTPPHDTYICLYDENMNLALKVCVFFPQHILTRFSWQKLLIRKYCLIRRCYCLIKLFEIINLSDQLHCRHGTIISNGSVISLRHRTDTARRI